ncbi:hypothetical protein CXG81DRAFT_29368 [Caulochytrium protostelioides]|uniref:ClpP/crotonase n=1 Tax=Caulochytrium protostelioides TaxID=1555241 RepID=A0A4P9XCG5_9FUNG|nr:hypothetical protein CXG81DRAFT_29368 [Caulochytrium protostelioides]|eukprot:RKP03147.1 hypothetical protein CXG81DRAFT_29368 [Caulochytrium protostelioides]
MSYSPVGKTRVYVQKNVFLSSEADAGIAVLTLNRPAAMNALGVRLLSQLSTCLAQLETEPDLARVLIVRSAVAGVFCAGADLKERAAMKPQEVRAFVNALRATFTRLEHLPMPTIAAIDGAALGGGLELALAADLRVVGGAKARLGVPETRLAIIPGAGGTQRLTRVVGLAKAKELAFTATPVGPDEAVRIGLANRAASEGRSAYDEALHLAQAMLPAGPIAMRMAKVAIHQGSQMDQASGMILEQQCYAQVIQTEDRLEGLNAFREKRKPVFHGR